jgi:hypothetical protein
LTLGQQGFAVDVGLRLPEVVGLVIGSWRERERGEGLLLRGDRLNPGRRRGSGRDGEGKVAVERRIGGERKVFDDEGKELERRRGQDGLP